MSDYFIALAHDGVLRETEDAVLFLFDEEEVWIPLKLIDEYDDENEVVVPRWFIEQEGLEAYEA